MVSDGSPPFAPMARFKNNIVRLSKRVRRCVAFVGGGIKRDFFEQFVVDIQADKILVPIHSPYMKLLQPFRVFELLDVPFHVVPTSVAKEQ